jgi:hypothetical protein
LQGNFVEESSASHFVTSLQAQAHLRRRLTHHQIMQGIVGHISDRNACTNRMILELLLSAAMNPRHKN